jgi:hypothetical protein
MKVSHSLHSNTKLNYSVLTMQNCNTATLYPIYVYTNVSLIKLHKITHKSGMLSYSTVSKNS